MKKYTIISIISFIFSVTGLVFLVLIFLGKLHSIPILSISLALVVIAALLSIYRWKKTKN